MVFFIDPYHLFISSLVFHSFSASTRDYHTILDLVKSNMQQIRTVLLPLSGKSRNFRPLKITIYPLLTHMLLSSGTIWYFNSLYISNSARGYCYCFIQMIFGEISHILSLFSSISSCVFKFPSGIHFPPARKPSFTNSFDGVS